MAQSRESTGSEQSRSGASGSSGSGNSGERSRSGSEGAGSGAGMSGQGTEIIGQAQDQAMKLVDTARQQATSQISTQQERLSGTLTTVATALHQASREMRNQDEGPIAEYVDTAANQVEQFANMLRDQDLEQLMTTTAQFARRQPALFLGAAFALGFAATRFIKSSAPSGSGQFGSRDSGLWYERPDGYGTSSYSSGYGYGGTVSDLGYSGTSGSIGQMGGSSSGGMGSSGTMGSGSGMGSEAALVAPRGPGDSGSWINWDRPAALVDQAVLAALVDRWGPDRLAPRVGPAPLELVARVAPVGSVDPPAQVARAGLVPGAARAQGVKDNPDPTPTRVRRGNDGASPR